MKQMAQRRILIVDDEESLARVLQKQLERGGAEVAAASSLSEARRLLDQFAFDLVLLDLELPDGHGLTLLRELREEQQDAVAVVILTGAATLTGAVEAMRLGATDYLAKPEDMQETMLAVEKALMRAEDQKRGFYARQRQTRAVDGIHWLGESRAAQELRHGIERVAAVLHPDAESLPAVLLVGETGTGKNLAARLLHASSPRQAEPFLQVDCGSLPASLIEGELFGHDRGAFTQANEARVGLLEAAERGVLLLDEIGEIPLELQSKLLAALDRRTVRRVGSNKETPLRAAIIAATNRDLADMVAAGEFRQDLYFRLHGLTLDVPSLRERREDIQLLAEDEMVAAARRFRRPCPRLTPEAVRALEAYPWPGNIRELKNVLSRVVLLTDRELVHPGDLGLQGGGMAAGAPPPLGAHPWEGLTLEALEREAVKQALEGSDGNVSAAARRLGISRGALRNRLDRFGLA